MMLGGYDSKIYKNAVMSLFEMFEGMCEGAVAVDGKAHVVWINEQYRDLLNLPDDVEILGKPIEDLIPNSLLRKVVETGRPILLDIMDVGDQSFVVTRMPVRDDHGKLTGAVGFVLYDKLDYLKPLVGKYANMRRQVTQAQNELAVHRRAKYSFHQIIGSSRSMVELKRQAKRAALQETTVILIGETGTGKELIAHAIHTASNRADGPFIGVNVAAVPENLLESEFFGTAPGAFTGADRKGRKGKFQVADGGTLFLDEVAEMPLHLQAKLLRALQEKEVEPLGSNKLERVDIRVVAATSRDIKSMLDAGEFRSDLYFRLNVLPLHLPPLRERKSDLPDLCEDLLERISVHAGAPPRKLTPQALAMITRYDWPGNIRELRNVLERATTLTDRRRLTPGDFAPILPVNAGVHKSDHPPMRCLQDQISEVEREAILTALEMTGGKRAPAAKLLGISRASLYDKLRKHGNMSDF